MRTAEERLTEFVRHVPMQKSSVKLVMNVPGDYVADEAEMRENLIRQVTSPVRWEQGVRRMDEAGVDLFIEIGCGRTLSAFNKRIGVKAPTLSLEKVEDLESIAKELA
jgi:[acyl-carrier-protein] S-malonyltransferase